MKEKSLSIHMMLPGFLFAVTLFICAPAGVYHADAGGFWFSFGDLLPYLFFFTAAAFVLITVLSCILPRKVSGVFRAGVYACSFLFWLQGTVLGQLSGVLNAVLWTAVIILFIVLAILLKDKFRRIVETAACILLVAQIVTAGYLYFKNQESQPEEPRFLSQKDELVLSSEANTVVFVPEAFDGQLMKQLLEKYPEETAGILPDFTFYPDTTGGVAGAKYAIPYLLTGKTNIAKQSYEEYISKEFNASPLIQELSGGKYSTGIYTSGQYVDLTRDDVIDNAEKGIPKASSAYELTKQFMKLTASRIVPAQMESLFRTYSGEFEKLKNSGNNEPYGIDDAALYQRLTGEGIAATVLINKPSFRFYHMSGVSEPYTLNRNLEHVPDGTGTEEEQALGTLRIIAEYMEQLKKRDIYDRTTVIVMADCGSPDHSDLGHCPLLMIKLPGMDHPFEISDIPLSYASMPEYLAEVLRNGPVLPDQWQQTGIRYFYDQSEENGVLNLKEYVNPGPGTEQKLAATGIVYHGDTARKTRKYTLDTELFFDARATAEDYQVSGFYEHEDGFTWTCGNDAEMLFELPEEPGDLEMVLRYRTFNGLQSVGVWANEKLVDIYYADGEMEELVIIPKGTVTGTQLRIRLELPDARSPAETGEGKDTRILALAMQSLVIREAELE
ncbi:MAG: hypothetical protein IJK71_00685 [Clostridia bacterium]|nr:hypothetical protein [Clostridia bacterium]